MTNVNVTTIEAVVDVEITQIDDVTKVLGRAQVCTNYDINANSQELFDKVMKCCIEEYGDKYYYRINKIMKWNM